MNANEQRYETCRQIKMNKNTNIKKEKIGGILNVFILRK